MKVLNGSEAMIGRTGGTTGTSCCNNNYEIMMMMIIAMTKKKDILIEMKVMNIALANAYHLSFASYIRED